MTRSHAGVAGLLALALAPACYSPTLRDCTVTCASSDDCARGQVCGADKLCAAPDTAGTCAERDQVDAGGHADAAMVDAAPATMATVHVTIDGKGSVTLDGYGICAAQGPQKGDCTYNNVPVKTQTIRVNLLPPTDPFQGWTSVTCKDAGQVCSFTPSVPMTTITAKFGK